MDLNELWIGDPVKIVSTEQRGKFEGISVDGKARVKVGRQILLVDERDLVLIPEKELKPKTDFDFNDFPKEEKKTAKEEPVKAYYFNAPPTPKMPLKTNTDFDLDESLEFNRKLDLHMEHYSDYNPRIWVNGELGFQVYKFKEFLNKAIGLRIPRVEIVYGIGQGVLRGHILTFLKTTKEVDRVHEINSGACEVWLTY